ncbi:MAG: hypothetical protein K2Y37_14210 [Pirellulales bacterium]|nr:hypothetical protein [Pirellulales bacterium]
MQRAMLGAAVGVGVGMSLVAVGVLLTTAWSVALLFPLLVPVLTAAAGFMIGRRLDRGRKPVKRFWPSLVAVVAAWPLSVLVPIWVREAQIRISIARTIPMHPACTLVRRDITTCAFDNAPGYILEFDCSQSSEKIVNFYRRELPKRGWASLPSVQQADYVVHQFRRKSSTLTLVGWVSENTKIDNTHVSLNKVRLSCCLANFTYRCPSLAELGYEAIGP